MSPQLMCIAQLYEVLAGVGVFDARIGKVLRTQGQLVLPAFTKLTPDRKVTPKLNSVLKRLWSVRDKGTM
jgi:hypothetical protein